jgi:sec-independent protein translocase protein TatA
VGGIGIWQLVIVLLIVMMLFGTKRLKGLGADVGDAIKGFRTSMGSDESKPESPPNSCLKDSTQASTQTEHKH